MDNNYNRNFNYNNKNPQYQSNYSQNSYRQPNNYQKYNNNYGNNVIRPPLLQQHRGFYKQQYNNNIKFNNAGIRNPIRQGNTYDHNRQYNDNNSNNNPYRNNNFNNNHQYNLQQNNINLHYNNNYNSNNVNQTYKNQYNIENNSNNNQEQQDKKSNNNFKFTIKNDKITNNYNKSKDIIEIKDNNDDLNDNIKIKSEINNENDNIKSKEKEDKRKINNIEQEKQIQLKEKIIKTEKDVEKEGTNDNIKTETRTRKLRQNKRLTIIEDTETSSNDEEEYNKSINKKKRIKKEISDDEYIPEDTNKTKKEIRTRRNKIIDSDNDEEEESIENKTKRKSATMARKRITKTIKNDKIKEEQNTIIEDEHIINDSDKEEKSIESKTKRKLATTTRKRITKAIKNDNIKTEQIAINNYEDEPKKKIKKTTVKRITRTIENNKIKSDINNSDIEIIPEKEISNKHIKNEIIDIDEEPHIESKTKKIKLETIDNDYIPNELKKTITKTGTKRKLKNESLVENELEINTNSPSKKIKINEKVNKVTKTKAKTVTKVGTKTKRTVKSKNDLEDISFKGYDFSEQNQKPSLNKNIQQEHFENSSWTDASLLSELCNCDYNTSKNFINLINNDNTIPFIARYRKELINNYSPDKLYEMKQFYNQIIELHDKSNTIINKIKSINKLTPQLKQLILNCKNIEELNLIYSPFKTNSKISKVEKAKKLGLEEITLKLLNKNVNNLNEIKKYINVNNKELDNFDKIKENIQYIIADIISKDTEVLEKLQDLISNTNIMFESNQTKQSENIDNYLNFQIYFQFSCNIKTIKPHAILAINRGEKLKILNINIKINEWVERKLFEFCRKKWLNNNNINKNNTENYNNYENNIAKSINNYNNCVGTSTNTYNKNTNYNSNLNTYNNYESSVAKYNNITNSSNNYEINQFLYKIFESSLNDSYKRLIKPFIIRNIRSKLNQKAEIASIQVFTSNLKQLLLVKPIRNKIIMAIDPGFKHGCKIAIIDIQGNVLYTDTLYIQFNNQDLNEINQTNAKKVINMIEKYNVDLIGIGNGTACREVENFLSNLIKIYNLNILYTIISEHGASIYSCSNIAKEEFPNLSPNIISAISLARRLQDPLSEYIKIEVSHLGIGMYQHDINEKYLILGLNDVITQCVSDVGVDINSTSYFMLKKINKITDNIAKNIIQYRNNNKCFKSRQELKKVKGIGDKIFEQIAGFVRVTFTGDENIEPNPLDSTWIHPESYDTVYEFAKDAKVNLKELGTEPFINKIDLYLSKYSNENLAEKYKISVLSFNFIIEALKKPKAFDLRNEFAKPLFRKGIQTIDDITPGTILSGQITNVTHFGCFIDVGLKKDALLHISKMKDMNLKLADKINVKVLEIDRKRERLDIEFVSFM